VRIRLLALAAVILVAFGASAHAFQGQSSPTLESARARWERLSPEDKARLQQNYERYRAMSEEERRTLAERARVLRDERERVNAELPPQTRERLQKLDPDTRREVMRDMVEGEVRERGARIREKMPDAWIQRLEQARPEDRARFLADFQHRARERVTLAAIDKIGRKLDLPREETERIKALPGDQRLAQLLELKKRMSARDAERFGLPDGMSPAQWNEWQALPPAEFFERMQRWRRERESEPRRGPEGQVMHELVQAMRPRADDWIDLASLSQGERRLRISHLRRERVVEVIRARGLLAPDEIDALERLPDGAFVRALREKVVRPLSARASAAAPEAPHRD
jgi:hypothetical protein